MPRGPAALKKKEAKERAEGLRKSNVGSDSLSFGAYEYLCKKFLESNDPEAVFALCWMVMAWNLISRMDELNLIRTKCVGWKNDSLTLTFFQSKGDQEGDQAALYHCFGNVDKPWLCLVTILAMYLSVTQERGATAADANPPLFPSHKAQANFNNVLKKLWAQEEIARDMWEQFQKDVTHWTAYFTRKGGASATTADSINTPPKEAAYKRAKWTLGNVKDTYVPFDLALVLSLPSCTIL